MPPVSRCSFPTFCTSIPWEKAGEQGSHRNEARGALLGTARYRVWSLESLTGACAMRMNGDAAVGYNGSATGEESPDSASRHPGLARLVPLLVCSSARLQKLLLCLAALLGRGRAPMNPLLLLEKTPRLILGARLFPARGRASGIFLNHRLVRAAVASLP